MNYQHIYHAGNFADVAKHVGLLYCLSALKRKPAAFFVLDRQSIFLTCPTRPQMTPHGMYLIAPGFCAITCTANREQSNAC